MFTFGFKDLIDKIEEYFGKGLTKAFMALIGVTLATFLVGFTIREAIYPFVLWVGSIVTGNPAVNAARDGANMVASVVAFVVIIAFLVGLFRARSDFEAAAQAKIDAEDLMGRVERANDEVGHQLNKLKQFIEDVAAEPGGSPSTPAIVAAIDDTQAESRKLSAVFKGPSESSARPKGRKPKA